MIWARAAGARAIGPWLGWAVACALLAGCPTDEPVVDVDPIVDPLSRPAEPTLSPSSFQPSDDCAACHPDHAAQWATSSHAYAMVDPVFRALVELRRADFDGAQDSFCLQCHTAIGTRGGEIVPHFDWDALSPVVQEGVTCEACHRVSALERPWNSGHVIQEGGPVRGGIADPASSPAHEASFSDLLTGASFCGGCHDVIELGGLQLERPYEEWTEGPAPEEGRPCQSCHMPTTTGPAAVGGPSDRSLHDHRFVGIDVPLSEGFTTAAEEEVLRTRIGALLDGAASLDLVAAPFVPGEVVDVVATLHNHIDGHNLPTGSTFLRQAWLELTATDADGTVLYRTGDLDANGDLRDHWSSLDPYGDADLVSYSSRLTAADGRPELFPWRANEHSSGSIPPRHARTSTLFVPTSADTPGPLQIQARVRLRTHPPHLLRALGLEHLVDRVETWDLATASLQVPRGP